MKRLSHSNELGPNEIHLPSQEAVMASRVFTLRALVIPALCAMIPLTAGCPELTEVTPGGACSETEFLGTLLSPDPQTTVDAVLQFSRRYSTGDENEAVDILEQITESFEVRDANGDLVYEREWPAWDDSQSINGVGGAYPARAVNLHEGGPLPAGDYTYTLTLDADLFLNQGCSGIYIPTSMTESFTIVEPPLEDDPGDTDPDPDPDPDPTNEAPIAEAGTNQTVAVGAAVNLDGSGSSDPEGMPLTYAWTQTAGTNVTLQNADTATPVFTAPVSVETLTFELTVTDDADATDTDTVTVTVTLGSQLFIVSSTDTSVIAHDLDEYADIDGDVIPDAQLTGATTGLSSPQAIVVNSADELVVLNLGTPLTPSITVYSNADTVANISGDIAPNRTVQGSNTLMGTPVSLEYDPGTDQLFVGDGGNASIHVFAFASTPAFSGDIVPAQDIRVSTFSTLNPVDLFLADTDELYVVDDTSNSILVFANASTLNGVVAPDRTIESTSFGYISAVVVTADDEMFVADRTGGQVYRFDNASTLNSLANSSVTITIPGASSLADLIIDPLGHGLLLDQTANAVFDFEGFAALSGTVAPDRTLQGVNTGLNSPVHFFLNTP